MTRRDIDPDVTRRDDGPYWAAVLALAIRSGDHERAEAARDHLQRLGYRLDLAKSQKSDVKGGAA